MDNLEIIKRKAVQIFNEEDLDKKIKQFIFDYCIDGLSFEENN